MDWRIAQRHPALLGSFRGWSAGKLSVVHFLPVLRAYNHPPSPAARIRCSQGGGVNRPARQLLGPASMCPSGCVVRSRRRAASELSSESHLRSRDGVNRGLRGDCHPTEHAFCRADISDDACCIALHAVGRSRRSAGEPWSDRSLRGVRRRSYGKATTLRSSLAVHASLALCRSPLAPRIRHREAQRYDGREARSRGHPTSSRHRSRLCIGLPCVQDAIAQSGISGWQLRAQMLARGSKQSAASAGVSGLVSLRECKLHVPCAMHT